MSSARRRRRRKPAVYGAAAWVASALFVAAAAVAVEEHDAPRPKPAPIPGLTIAPEQPRTGYDREEFPHWLDDEDDDQCNAREEVLIAESTVPAQVVNPGCKVTAGSWTSVYDGLVLEDPRKIDVDHVVALGEAWDSGAGLWSQERRQAFANDLSSDLSLRAVSAASNRSKSDNDPAEWLPTVVAFRCQYVQEWVAVKVAWELSADRAEVRAIRAVLKGCG